jgi:3-methyladenine DNA glycosylase AlkD
MASTGDTDPLALSLLTDELLDELRAHANPDNVAGMARFGISSAGTLGVTMPVVRGLASTAKKRVGSRNAEARHELALLLWQSGVHEARIMASLVDAPALVDDAQAESWVLELESWDVCDQLCMNLLRKAPLAWDKAVNWTARDEEFVKRAGFVIGATLAVHNPEEETRLASLLALAERECTDERNFVKKAVNWQVRQIGKRSATLNPLAIAACERMLADHPDSKSARWIARDALRELRSEAVRERLGLQSP